MKQIAYPTNQKRNWKVNGENLNPIVSLIQERHKQIIHIALALSSMP